MWKKRLILFIVGNWWLTITAILYPFITKIRTQYCLLVNLNTKCNFSVVWENMSSRGNTTVLVLFQMCFIYLPYSVTISSTSMCRYFSIECRCFCLLFAESVNFSLLLFVIFPEVWVSTCDSLSIEETSTFIVLHTRLQMHETLAKLWTLVASRVSQ